MVVKHETPTIILLLVKMKLCNFDLVGPGMPNTGSGIITTMHGHAP